MRRAIGSLVVVALVAVLYPRVAFAYLAPSLTAPGSDDFGTQIFRRAFSEAADVAAPGDGSFFGTYAFRVDSVPVGAGTALVRVPSTPVPHLLTRLYTPPSSQGVSVSASAYSAAIVSAAQAGVLSSPGPVIGLYQEASPQPTVAPSSFRFDLTNSTDYASRLVTFSPVMNPQQAFTAGAAGPDPAATLPQAQAAVSVPVRVGNVHFAPHVEGAQANVPGLSLRDNAVNTGATFKTRVGSKNFDVDVSSGFEHLTVNDPQFNASSFDNTSNFQLSGGTLPLLVPAYADVSKRTLSAGLGVPVARNVTVNVQAATQHLQGGYGSPGLSNLDATNDVYGGKVTFQLPHSASAISLSAKQYRFQDNLFKNNAFTQTSADVNFTVKF